MKIIQIYKTETDWCTVVDNNGQRLTLTYQQKPLDAAALADANAVFNPPTVTVTDEDGTTQQVPSMLALDMRLTAPQKTAVQTAIATYNTIGDKLQGRIPSDPAIRSLIRSLNPLYDALLAAAERLTS